MFTRKNSNATKAKVKAKILPITNLEKEPWFIDLLGLSNDELMRVYCVYYKRFRLEKCLAYLWEMISDALL